MNPIPIKRFFPPVLLALLVLLAPGYAVVQQAGAGVAPTVHVAPTSIDRTGTSDVTAALVAFIKSVPDGSTITFPPSSRYRIEGIVLVGARHNLIIDGAGAYFFATTDGSGVAPSGPNGVQQHWPRHRNQWFVYDSSYITVRNLVVRGANALGGTSDAAEVGAYEAQAGFEFSNTTHSKLQNCTITKTYGDLVYIGTNATDILVQGCTLMSSGRQGITVADADRVAIDHNDIEQIRRTAIDLEPFVPQWGVRDVWVVYNTIKSIRLTVVGAKGTGDVSNIVVAYNHLFNEPLSVRNTPAATVTPARHDWYVVGNVSDTKFGAPLGAFWITATKNVVIRDNYQPLQAGRGQVATTTTGSTNVSISGNQFPEI
jgi:hypothetical protein